jgi:acetyl-CoA carboxylase carboxyltransferase component
MRLVFLGESSGSRVPDSLGAEAMAAAGQDPQQYCRRRETPWVSAVLGPCLGSSTWYTCLSDFVVMRKGAFLAVSSARVTSLAIGEAVDPEELGGWKMHAEQTGLVDVVVNSDEEALAAIRRFLGYLPSHSGTRPPSLPADQAIAPHTDKLLDLVPAARSKTYDMRKVIAGIVDEGQLLQPEGPLRPRRRHRPGALERRERGHRRVEPDVQGRRDGPRGLPQGHLLPRAVRLVQHPIVFLVDTPGFLVGIEGERKARRRTS